MSAENAKSKAEFDQRMERQHGETVTTVAERRHYEEATLVSRHHHDEPTVENTPFLELDQRVRVHKRTELAEDLAKNKDTWEQRRVADGGHTTVEPLGHFATDTQGWHHRLDASAAATMTDAEQAEHRRLKGRHDGAADLAKQKVEWTQRQETGGHATTANKLGHFAEGTAVALAHKTARSPKPPPSLWPTWGTHSHSKASTVAKPAASRTSSAFDYFFGKATSKRSILLLFG
jgi:hypothetical protein